MHPISSSFKSLGRAAVVALSLAGAAILSVPVQASSGNQPQFSFSLQLARLIHEGALSVATDVA
jgi:hypothetical protein